MADDDEQVDDFVSAPDLILKNFVSKHFPTMHDSGRLGNGQIAQQTFREILRKMVECAREWTSLPSIADSAGGEGGRSPRRKRARPADGESDDEIEITAQKTEDEMLKEQFDLAKLSGRCPADRPLKPRQRKNNGIVGVAGMSTWTTTSRSHPRAHPPTHPCWGRCGWPSERP